MAQTSTCVGDPVPGLDAPGPFQGLAGDYTTASPKSQPKSRTFRKNRQLFLPAPLTGPGKTGIAKWQPLREHRVCRANRYSLHSFRHTFVSFCANAGVPLDVVADIVGHSSSVMTRYYAHISDDAKLNAIQTLPLLSKENLHKTSREIFLEKIQAMTDTQIDRLLQQVQ